MYRLLSCFFPIISLFFFSGSCSFEENPISVEIIRNDDTQALIENIIKSRVQICDYSYQDFTLSLILEDSIISIDTHSIPYIYNISDRWMINDDLLFKGGSVNSFQNMRPPILTVTSEGRLLVNGKPSKYQFCSRSVEFIHNEQQSYWAILSIGAYLCFYYSKDSMITIPIAYSSDNIIPDYFFDCVVEKEKKAEKVALELPNSDVLSYVFFTDAHWGGNQRHSPAIIKHIVDYTPINQVLFGGDVITVNTPDIQSSVDLGNQFHEAFSFLGSRLYCLFGNHDDNSCGQAVQTERHLSEEQVYSYLQSQMSHVHYWDYYNFYYDDPVSKTRFICFDTGRWYERLLRGSTLKTARFAIECLYSVPEGWHVIAASHIWSNLKNYETGETQESVYVRPLIEILENYNYRKNGEFSYGGETIYYDFSNAGGTIEYCIGGHTHSDFITFSKGGLPLITVTSDGQVEVAGGAPCETGTINEQCVTIVVNDYQDRKVSIIHIGRGEDVVIDMWGKS